MARTARDPLDPSVSGVRAARTGIAEPSNRRLGWVRTLSAGLLVSIAALWTFGFVAFLVRALRGDYEIVDFHFYYTAAHAVVHGHSPYLALNDPAIGTKIAYVYPPLTAIVTAPFTLLPLTTAGTLAVTAIAAAVVGTLLVLGVRDWRCYVVALCWRPVLFAILTGNVTIVLGLAAAVAWRFRDRTRPAAWSIGLALAAKLFMWPLVVWLAATRRRNTALLACAVGAAVLVGSWAVIAFAGLTEFPDLLRRAQELQEHATYTIYALSRDLGASPFVARALGVGLDVALLAGVVALGRRGDDRGAFVLAIAASIAFTPIVWLHYFALLIVVVGVAQPRLGPAWFVPLAMWVAPGVGGTAFQKAVTLLAAAVTIALLLWPQRVGRRAAQGSVGSDETPASTSVFGIGPPSASDV